MFLRLGLAAAFVALTACSGDGDSNVAEPVSASQDAAKIPDAPGADTGEAAPKVAEASAAAAAGDKAPSPDVEKSVSPVAPPLTVKPAKLHVRQGPGTNHPVVRTLKSGDSVTPLGCEKHWCKIAEGEFVAQKYLLKAPQ